MDFCYCFSRLTFSNSAPAVIQDWRVFEHKKIFIGDCGGQIDSAGEWTAFSVSLHGSNMHKCNYWGRVGIAETNQPRPPPSLKSVSKCNSFAMLFLLLCNFYITTALPYPPSPAQQIYQKPQSMDTRSVQLYAPYSSSLNSWPVLLLAWHVIAVSL